MFKLKRLTQVQTQLTALSTTVEGLSTSTEISSLSTALTAAQTEIAAITAALADVSSAADLAVVNEALASVQEDVNTLLESDAVINQNITINNSATLEYVSTLIAYGEDDPNVIVNGSVTIDTEDLTAAELATTNEIAAKLATVLGNTTDDGVTVTSDSPITFTNLSFIDANYVIMGSDMDDAALRTVTGDLDVDHGGVAAAFDYSQLASVGGDFIISTSDAATVTSINLSNIDIEGDARISAAGTAGVLDFPCRTKIQSKPCRKTHRNFKNIMLRCTKKWTKNPSLC